MNPLKRELTALQRATDAAGQELLALLRHAPDLRRRLQALDPLDVLAARGRLAVAEQLLRLGRQEQTQAPQTL